MKLTHLRNTRGLTQRELAAMIDMDAATVNRAEKMAPSTKLATYVKCAEVLGVTLSDIFCEDRNAIEAELVAAFRAIPQERHQELLGLIRLAASHRSE